MKRKITLLFAAVAGFFAANAQLALNESFNAPWSAAGAGWSTINLSAPASTNTPWFQGNPSAFTAFVGGTNNYIANNFQQIPANNAGGISSWLITPTLNLVNGAVLSFATRCPGTATVYPDRMQVRMSQAGTNTTIPTGTTSVGTFTTLMLDINPLLNTNITNTAVSNGTVNGYPGVWTVYNLTVTGVTGTVSGRFAFRYFVDNGGQNGNNSDYIGLDEVKYSIPCSGTVASFTTCPSTSVTLMASGVNSGSTYTWNPGGSNATSITVAPAVTTVYSLTLNDNGTACPVKTATVTIGTSLNVNVTASSSTVCAGSSVTLTAMSAATSYTWSTLANGSTIAVTPTANTTYSVGGSSGACFGGNTIAIVVNQPPSVTSVSVSGYPTGNVCVGSVPSLTLVANGGTSYSWVNPPAGPASGTLSINTPTASGNYPINVSVIGSNGCGQTTTVALVVSPSPTVTLAFSGIPTGTLCLNTSTAVTLLSSGAVSYNWSPISSSTLASISVTSPTVAGNYTYAVVGTGSNTCTRTATITLNVANCTGIQESALATNLSVYPNPFTTEIYVSGINGSVEVVNMLGQVVLTTSVNENEKINTTNFAKGVYFVKVRNEQGVEVKTTKLIKN